MLFNSVEYLIFFPAVLALYFALPVKWRWVFLLAASYFFYMAWKAEYVLLILFTTLVDYLAAIRIWQSDTKKKKRVYLVISVVVNLGMLAGFKYLDFFSGSINMIFSGLGIDRTLPLYHILLPVGISFFVFQSLSYTIDVYRGIRPPERNAGKYALYVSFFPQLVAGPIERSTSLLPQILQPRSFSQERLVSGLKLMLWGYFKKLVIADRLGLFVSKVYDNPSDYNGLPVILATVLFAFQLYCDFSAYTDIARGSARALGYDLMINFNRPLTAKSLRDFWNRWHISLTTWFRDYVLYSMPYVKGRRVVYGRLYFNLFLTFLLMGLWHGAAWTFVVFGAFHGLLLVLESTTEGARARFYEKSGLNRLHLLKSTLTLLVTFSLVVFSLFFFRANNFSDSLSMISGAFDFSNSGAFLKEILKDNEVLFGMLMVVVLLVAEQLQERYDLVRAVSSRPVAIRWALYSGFLFFVILFGVLHKQMFIYFQF